MVIDKIRIEKLKASEYNPRKDLKSGDAGYEKLKRSIQEFGYVEPIIWNKATGNVVGGHQRLKVLKDLGEEEITCVVLELDETKEKALNVALNKIQGEWDTDKLTAILMSLDEADFDVSLTGFDGAEIDELMNEFYSQEAIQDDFNVDEAKEKVETKGAETKVGDVWLLGKHRLMCGDPTSEVDFAKLVDGKKAQMAVTMPPNAQAKDYEANGIEPWKAEMRAVIKNLTRYAGVICWNTSDLYGTGTQYIEPTNAYSMEMFAERGFRPIWIRVWKKQGKNVGVGSYHITSNKPEQQHEYITAFSDRREPEYNDQEYAWLSAFAGHSYKFVKRLTKDERKKWGYAGIWEMNATRLNNEQQGMCSVELPWRCIKMHSDKEGIVLEPFSGSGTTIIACEQLDRVCYAMEKSPDYCDVAVKRWEEFTGQKAVKAC